MQIDGAQWQLISYKVRKGITFGYWSYRYVSILLSRQLKARATIFSLKYSLKMLDPQFRIKLLAVEYLVQTALKW